MNYAKVYSGQLLKFPYSFSELQEDNPFTNYDFNVDVAEVFPHTEEAVLRGRILVEVVESPMPEHNSLTHCAIARNPVLLDGVWIKEWDVVAKSEEEIAALRDQKENMVNTQIAMLIENSDWMQLADSTADKQAWATYRQALRDITTQAGFPWTITWPDAP